MTTGNNTAPDQMSSEQPKKGFMRVSQTSLEPDWFLQKQIDFTNQFRISTSVTIQVGGGSITGMTISADTYMRLFSEAYCGSIDSAELSKVMSSVFEEYIKDYAPKADDIDRPSPVFIHLYDAHFSDASGNFSVNDRKPTLWRGRLSAVDGFFLGTPVTLRMPPSA